MRPTCVERLRTESPSTRPTGLRANHLRHKGFGPRLASPELGTLTIQSADPRRMDDPPVLGAQLLDERGTEERL